ncbi:hypothetical protein Lesp02_14380 [Lentzea sp. NBRC 105346]|uniref:FAD/NAD(P)-binding protein n=1 Tax=Lentzea sp. NBRC 105346 TaxID=3032205 RepID=UPI0024A0D6F5|nr:FAD/NAD(P)-binding protein [Lentzea sp. NBRC 105346]GLZ29248.1 hypothetical protein Lesp02_14380 [Lentzea sp. NBRC 105346]
MTFRLAIVGGGPRATYALERLSATADRLRGRDLEVRIFELSGEFGAGQVHSARQSKTSYLNRISRQVGFSADETVTDAGPLRPPGRRPTLYEWSRRRFAETGDPDFDLRPEDWPKRYVHGTALREMFAEFVADLRAHATVHLHAEEVTDVVREAGGLRVVTPRDSYPADHVLLLTGHSHHDPLRSPETARLAEFAHRNGLAYVPSAYPLETALAVDQGAVVGCAGMGLTAIDVALHLTEGRGGRFESVGGELVYRASGAEPASVVAFSQTGLFTYARPENFKEADPARLEHKGVFLTTEAIDRLRESVGVPVEHDGGKVRQLDFERDVLPLVRLEMAYLHYTTLLGPLPVDEVRPSYEAFLDGRPADPLGALERAVDVTPRFSWHDTINPMSDVDNYREAVLAFMRRDHRWAAEGNLANPHKAAADGVWRDLRSVLSYAVDDGGLTPASHRVFLSTYTRHHNRLANGAALVVMEKIRALIEHGILDVGAGPDARVALESGRFQVVGPRTGFRRPVDTLVDARVHPFDPRRDALPLYRAMLAAGTVTLWKNGTFTPGGLNLSDRFHPVRSDGVVDHRITIMGPATEGQKSFLLAALRPCQNHYVMRDVLVWLEDFWRMFEV